MPLANEKEFPDLEKMAIRDIPVGKEVYGEDSETYITGFAPSETNWYEYQHVIPPEHQKDYTIYLRTHPSVGYDYIKAHLIHRGPEPDPRLLPYMKNPKNWNQVGSVSGQIYSDAEGQPLYTEIGLSDIKKLHRGKGLGRALYEAIAAHTLNKYHAKRLAGGAHSTLAHSTHASLARKHGLDYVAQQINEPGKDGDSAEDPFAYDSAYGNYDYILKSENHQELIWEDETELENLAKSLPKYNPRTDPYLNEQIIESRISPINLKEYKVNQREGAARVQSSGGIWDTRDNLVGSQVNPFAKARMLHKLRSHAKVRMTPDGLEYLLHRSTGKDEYDNLVDNNYYNNPRSSSWTADINIAKRHQNQKYGVLSSWIPESKIHSVPFMWGDTTLDPNKAVGNPLRNEFEVLVHPGSYALHVGSLEKAIREQDVQRLDGVHLNKHHIVNPDYHLNNTPHQAAKDQWLRDIIHTPEYPLMENSPGGYQSKQVLVSPTTNKRYLIKPYFGDQSGDSYLNGWAEMTNQALYHAAGIGHLHQKVFMDNHVYPYGQGNHPSVIVEMAPGYETAGKVRGVGAFDPNEPSKFNHQINTPDARKINIMDYLVANSDRHEGNYMLDKTTGQPLAIDHGECFMNYWNDPIEVKKPYKLMVPDGLEEYRPVADWWHDNKPKILAELDRHLPSVLDPLARKEIRDNFHNRANHLDNVLTHFSEPGLPGQVDSPFNRRENPNPLRP